MQPKTPEHQARADAVRAKLAAMSEQDRRRSISVLDSISGFGDDEIHEMSEEEIRTELEAVGIDPDALLYNVMGGVLASTYRIIHDLRARVSKGDDALAEAQAEIERLHNAVRAGVNTVVVCASPIGLERLAQQCAEEAGAKWPHDTPGAIDDSAVN